MKLFKKKNRSIVVHDTTWYCPTCRSRGTQKPGCGLNNCPFKRDKTL